MEVTSDPCLRRGLVRPDDARTGEVVIADDDPRVVLEKAKGRNHVVVRGRVPRADEPIYVGLG